MAKEAPEGVVAYSSATGVIDYSDVLGQYAPNKGKYQETELTVLSTSFIEAVDLLSEGPIEGLATGNWILSGIIGEIGYRSGRFVPYLIPTGEPNPTGTHFKRSIHYNEVPIYDDRGKSNFQFTEITPTIGTPNGAVIHVSFPNQKASRTIGERLRKDFPKTYRILNKDCRGCVLNVKVPALFETRIKDGDILRSKLEYSISYRPIYSDSTPSTFILAENEVIFGKINNGYIRPTRIDFSATTFFDNKNFIGWEIKVERTTDESVSVFINNASYIESLTEIHGNVFTYPNSAMVRNLFDAEYFQTIPQRIYDTQLIKVKIPGNYDPILKSYRATGFATTNSGWDGTFATGKYWTSNPAWCFYDLLTNSRYGLGRYVDSSFIDKWSLYEIGQYCDTLVSDGEGGIEPRFTCNVWIASREDAYRVINDMAGIFRAVTYYANGLIYAVQDAPKTDLVTFTNANVENGDFSYSSTSKKNRHSIAIVRYNDPRNLYKPAIEYVEDLDSIRKYGVREIEVGAFGCTSRSQAIRLGRWILLSDNLETETVSFSAGMEGTFLRPGDVFKVFDSHRKTKRHGGRVISINNVGATGSTVILDGPIELETNVQYKLSVITPSFVYDTTQVTGLTSLDYSNIRRPFVQKFLFSGFQSSLITNNTRTQLDLYSGFDNINYDISGRNVWSLELGPVYESYTGIRYFSNPNFDYYKVLNIIEKEGYKYDIIGLQYNVNKFHEIESGLSLQRNLIAINKVPSTPHNLTFNVFERENQTQYVNYSFLVDDFTNINSYKVYAKVNNYANNSLPSDDYLIANLPAETTSENFTPSESGQYYFRVYSSNDIDGILSAGFATGSVLINEINPITNFIISSLVVNDFEGTYEGLVTNGNVNIITSNDSSPTFNWQVGYQSNVAVETDVKFRITVREIDDNGSRIPTNNILYEATGIEVNNFQFELQTNIETSGGPHRNYQFIVEAHNNQGFTSAGHQIGVYPELNWNKYPYGYDIVDMFNPRQTGIEMSNSIDTLRVSGGSTDTVVAHNYISAGYMGTNGEVMIRYSQGEFDEDLAGGFMYTSNQPFPKLDAQIHTGYYSMSVDKTQFSFDPKNPVIYNPIGALGFKGAPFIYTSLSFFDEVDSALINRGVDISTGLYLSNNAYVLNNPAAGSITLGGIQFFSVIQLTGNGTDSALISRTIGAGSSIVSTVVNPVGGADVPSTLVTIFYMGFNTINSIYSGIGGSGTPIDTQGAGQKVTSPTASYSAPIPNHQYDVTLSCSTAGATIYKLVVAYGAAAVGTYSVYTSTFKVPRNRTLYIYATKAGMENSLVVRYDKV